MIFRPRGLQYADDPRLGRSFALDDVGPRPVDDVTTATQLS
jgi:hypothetical protein